MYGLKGWILPIIVLIALIVTIWVGIYQLNSDGNPWYFGESEPQSWYFLDGK
jgi:hypothetical protein